MFAFETLEEFSSCIAEGREILKAHSIGLAGVHSDGSLRHLNNPVRKRTLLEDLQFLAKFRGNDPKLLEFTQKLEKNIETFNGHLNQHRLHKVEGAPMPGPICRHSTAIPNNRLAREDAANTAMGKKFCYYLRHAIRTRIKKNLDVEDMLFFLGLGKVLRDGEYCQNARLGLIGAYMLQENMTLEEALEHAKTQDLMLNGLIDLYGMKINPKDNERPPPPKHGGRG